MILSYQKNLLYRYLSLTKTLTLLFLLPFKCRYSKNNWISDVYYVI